MERLCPCCKRNLDGLQKVYGKSQEAKSSAPKGAVDYAFCVQPQSLEEAVQIVANFSGMTNRLKSPWRWRAGTLRWSAWTIVVSDGGVYVQGDPGPLYDRGNDRTLVLS